MKIDLYRLMQKNGYWPRNRPLIKHQLFWSNLCETLPKKPTNIFDKIAWISAWLGKNCGLFCWPIFWPVTSYFFCISLHIREMIERTKIRPSGKSNKRNGKPETNEIKVFTSYLIWGLGKKFLSWVFQRLILYIQ